jgi:lactoylglutathione lyase
LLSVGLGVSDLDKSTQFYTDLLGMTVQRNVTREDRVERVLGFPQSDRGSTVTLLHYTDGAAHNYQNGSAKLVFLVPDLNPAVAKWRASGATIILEPVAFAGSMVTQALDPDGYTTELVQRASDSTSSGTYLLAQGFGVSDLAAATAFYSKVGMMPTDVYDLGTLKEQVMTHTSGKGSGLVLMHWSDDKHVYKDNPLSQVHGVPDAAAFLTSIKDAGGTVLTQPAAAAAYSNARLGVARDPDGYVLEIVQ